MRVEFRAVAPDANPYLVMYSIFKTGLEGETAKIKNLRSAERYLPDNIYTAIENFEKAEWTTKLFGGDVKGRYADLKRASADRCARSLGTIVKAPEVQHHHEVTTSSSGTCSRLRRFPICATLAFARSQKRPPTSDGGRFAVAGVCPERGRG